MRLLLDEYAAPIAKLLLVTDETGALRALEFADLRARMHRMLGEQYESYELDNGTAPRSIVRALDKYFAGDLSALVAVRTTTAGTTFQRTVWKALRTIKPGTTTSYGKLATRIARPTASRAVGAANGSNPISIVVPCHRVIGANGALTGYGGGLPRKVWLLEHERRFAVARGSKQSRIEASTVLA